MTTTTRRPLRIQKPGRPFNSKSELDPMLLVAPYEETSSRVRPVTNSHGGYGVRHGDFITGPFGFVENALHHASKRGGYVVRWADFVKETVLHQKFRALLMARTEPFVVETATVCPGYARVSVFPHD